MQIKPLRSILAKGKTSREMTGEELQACIDQQHAPAKLPGVIRAAIGGDLHLLHPRVPTYHIAHGLQDLFIRYQTTLDVIILTGDVLDDSRYLSQEMVHDFLAWAAWLLDFCKVNGIKLWIMEGTPSHDHKQSRIFERLNETIGANLKYLSGMGIFHDEDFDLTVGWVEDEYKRVAADTEKEFDELLKTHCLSSVDIMLMHGCFTFQIPQIKTPSTFDEAFWVKRVKKGIYIAHDHNPKEVEFSSVLPNENSNYGSIRVTGSWERLAQNEEGDKGFTIADITDVGVKNYFHVNYAACPQITVRVKDDYDELYQDCISALKYIDSHPSSHIGRLVIEYPDSSPIADHISEWKKDFNFYISGKKITDKKKEEEIKRAFEVTTEKLETVTKSNAARLMFEELDEMKANYDSNVVHDVMQMVI